MVAPQNCTSNFREMSLPNFSVVENVLRFSSPSTSRRRGTSAPVPCAASARPMMRLIVLVHPHPLVLLHLREFLSHMVREPFLLCNAGVNSEWYVRRNRYIVR